MAYDVTLITGDGTGPELAEAARKCVDATGVKINWDVQEAGVDVMERTGNPLPPAVLESVRRNKVALKAPITTPVGTTRAFALANIIPAFGRTSAPFPSILLSSVRTRKIFIPAWNLSGARNRRKN